MKLTVLSIVPSAFLALNAVAAPDSVDAQVAPPVPRFSIGYMDPSVDPTKDFYHFADGTWVKNNPVPPDKSRWGSFNELAERNWFLIHGILANASQDITASQHSPQRKVGDF
jgi:predicted metalloendopeptidase